MQARPAQHTARARRRAHIQLLVRRERRPRCSVSPAASLVGGHPERASAVPLGSSPHDTPLTAPLQQQWRCAAWTIEHEPAAVPYVPPASVTEAARSPRSVHGRCTGTPRAPGLVPPWCRCQMEARLEGGRAGRRASPPRAPGRRTLIILINHPHPRPRLEHRAAVRAPRRGGIRTKLSPAASVITSRVRQPAAREGRLLSTQLECSRLAASASC